MKTVEERAKELGMVYIRRDHTPEEIEQLRRETDIEAAKHYCACCHKRLYSHFAYCIACAEELGIFQVPYSYWPDQVKIWANDQRKIEKQEAEWLKHVTDLYINDTDEEIESLVVQKQMYDNWARCQCLKSLDEVLEEYNISKDEYDILTADNLAILACHMGINHDAARKRRQRIIKKVNTFLDTKKEAKK